jgi:hypothetical protein
VESLLFFLGEDFAVAGAMQVLASVLLDNLHRCRRAKAAPCL